MIAATTALRKIAALKKRIWCVQGGQGASKTYSILILLINHASGNPNKEIFICSHELSKMRITVIKDFVKIIKELNLEIIWTGGTFARFPNGSFIKFIGLDKQDIGKGLRSDIIFINECNKVNFETYRELTSRAKRIILDYNPNNRFWVHDEIIPRDDCSYINLTFQDNEFLSEEERNEILSYKAKGYNNEDGTIKSEYWANKWRIYGLGEIGGVEGRIYYWQKCTIETFNTIDAKEYIGVDWGKVDPFAVVGVKYKDGKLYVHEYNYDSENVIMQRISTTTAGQGNEPIVRYVFEKANIQKDAKIITDNNQPTKLKSLWDGGWYNAQGIKNKLKITERISILQELEVYYTEMSKNIENEQYESCWAKDRAGNSIEEREDINNHTLDAVEYVVTYLKINGIIK
jgi:phage terminase large subunit